MPYVLPALNVTCQQKVKTESYQDTETQIKKFHLQVCVCTFYK